MRALERSQTLVPIVLPPPRKQEGKEKEKRERKKEEKEDLRKGGKPTVQPLSFVRKARPNTRPCAAEDVAVPSHCNRRRRHRRPLSSPEVAASSIEALPESASREICHTDLRPLGEDVVIPRRRRRHHWSLPLPPLKPVVFLPHATRTLPLRASLDRELSQFFEPLKPWRNFQQGHSGPNHELDEILR